MRLIKSEFCGQFAIYRRRDLVFLNFYCRYSSLVLISVDGTANILYSREVVTQGDPMYMVAYKIGVLPLIKHLKLAYPDVTHPWYSNKYGALITFDNLDKFIYSLKRHGPAWGSYPGTTKTIMIAHPNNLKVW